VLHIRSTVCRFETYDCADARQLTLNALGATYLAISCRHWMTATKGQMTKVALE